MRTLVRATFMTMIALVFVMASVADAATTYTDTIDGAEYAATSQTGWFAGTASGDLPGTFDTMVQHTPLSPDGTITGGTFALYTVVAGSAATVTGTFVPGGTVTLLTKGNACKDQVYAVSGTLPNVGVSGTGTGTGTFSATLTHYRQRWGSRCVTYFATMSGSVTLAF